MTIAIATMIPAPMMISARITPMKAILIEDQVEIVERVLTEGATWAEEGKKSVEIVIKRKTDSSPEKRNLMETVARI